jgi:hypothetical protein
MKHIFNLKKLAIVSTAIFAFGLLLFPLVSSAYIQVYILGCTDLNANNYSSFAQMDDGSCTYDKSITISSPTDGSFWYCGKTYNIIWGSVGIGQVDIYLMNDTLGNTLLGSGIDSPSPYGTYNLSPSKFTPGENYYVRILDSSDPSVYTDSGLITVVGCEIEGCMDSTANNYNSEATVDDDSCTYDKSIVISSPTDGSFWYCGKTYNIIWGSVGIGQVDIYLMNDILGNTLLGSGIDSPYPYGTYNLSPSKFTPGENYYVRILDSSDPSVYTDSGLITVVGCEVSGCTDPEATNYDSEATVDDDSCEYAYPTGSITVCKMIIDSENNIVDGSEVAGAEFNIFNTLFTTPLTLNADLIGNDGINDSQCVVYSGLALKSYNYSEEVYPETGWMTPLYNDQFTADIIGLDDFFTFNSNEDSNGAIDLTLPRGPNRTLVVLNQYEEEVIDISGCTDPEANNYNENATIDDGSCTYDIFGCTNPAALNYNCLATVDDGSCQFPPYETRGCTDPNATNYNPSATENDGSCVYEAKTGSITVCKMIIDSENNIVDGSEIAGAEFSIFNTLFTTPLTLNADLLGNDGINDSQCVVYSGLALGSHHYSEEVYPETGWMTPLYNDQYSINLSSLNDAFVFNPNDLDSDGNINLTKLRPNRTLIVLNQYEEIAVLGCTDPEATNYNSLATVDDNSCEYIIYGCIDPNATNYNSEANVNNGSCQYENACNPNSSNWKELDRIDIGNPLSEAGRYLSGWSEVNLLGNYGGCQQGAVCTYRQVLEPIEMVGCALGGPCNSSSACTEEGREANFTLNTGNNVASKIVIRHLDGVSLMDSFDLYRGDLLLGHFEDDTQITSEVWRETEFDVSQYGFQGLNSLTIRATDDIWNQCSTYGQVAIDWISVEGCDSLQPDPTGSITVCKMIIDSENNIVDGSEISGAEFSIFNTLFTTPLTLNADLIGNDGINDSQCVVYSGLALGSHHYSEEVYPETGWMTPLYNDQFTTTVNGLSDLIPFDINDTNVDGHIVLNEGNPNRILVILNQYQPIAVSGCTSSTATNYNPLATVDDGSCEYPINEIPGCMDSTANNYNENATIDDDSCTYDILGCMDLTANNYNENATVDNNSCTYDIFGCTNSGALNYNPNATSDDGSCEYSGGGGGGGGGGVTLTRLKIFNELTGDARTLTVILTWQTNIPATSRVIYDTVSHPELGVAPNYGYAYSTVEDSNRVVVHSVTISGLLPNTTYYWRAISNASPEIWGEELTFTTGDFTSSDILGCTDISALNYNSKATKNDGSCQYSQVGPGPEEPQKPVSVSGCTDVSALNYDSNATVNDDSCEYAEEKPEFTLDFSDDDSDGETKGLLATIGGLFTKGNICWLLLALIIIIITLFIFSERKDDLVKERKRKLYFLIIIAILMIIYYFLCPLCFYCWIVMLILLAIAIISMFFKGSKKEEIEY